VIPLWDDGNPVCKGGTVSLFDSNTASADRVFEIALKLRKNSATASVVLIRGKILSVGSGGEIPRRKPLGRSSDERRLT